MKILVLNGVNMNLLGKREPEVYGKETVEDLENAINEEACKLGVNVRFFQSNHEGEITAAKSSAYWNGLYIEYFSEPGYVEILTEREEDYNGFPCVYLEMKNYEDDTLKVHISKEYGVVMSYEHYNKDTDLKLLECKRNHFEVGTVADDEFELPSDINFQQVPTY
jgi:hypothetical protein